ncbi:MAG: phosphonopyruvate decarboxylase [Lachnospiraceae bacterium]|nr:phosphonopyruvate decarboxylase [Lachnospiraceae bacterium]
MIDPKEFYDSLLKNKFHFFTGVPDSLLKELCLCIKDLAPEEKNIIAANEGNSIALASGYHIVTGKYGVVYMQNSGLGNVVNPLLSLADEKVYEIPMLLIVGYRGEPGVKDEPQHKKQGELTLPLLDTLGIEYIMLDENFEEQIGYCFQYIEKNRKTIAMVVKKDTFAKYDKELDNQNSNELTREEVLETIIKSLDNKEYIVSTTGKTSREIFEIRDRNKMDHGNDFLTVGSMGHASSLALGMSLFSKANIYCIDGDGAFLMHMGGLAVAIQNAKDNFKYILVNNGCHESVGKQPTIAYQIEMDRILKGFGFQQVITVNTSRELTAGMEKIKQQGKTALIINTNDKSRKDLGRPTTSPKENKENFQKKIRSNK